MALPPLSPEDIQRYHRHLIIPEVGSTGQRKLKAARVLLIGAGGLGSPAALYLAAAGVGTLGLVDFDVVDVSNLQRQILHGTSWIGKSKVESGKSRLHELNPLVHVVGHEEPLTSENAMRIFEQYDIIVNGCDNFPTTVYLPGQGCYRCLYPAPPPPGAVPSCAEAGVLGVLPGFIGVMQAIETVKLILGLGESLAGRLVLFDALDMKMREVRVRRDPACPVCGDNPTIHELIDYEEFCGMPHRESSVEAPVPVAV